MEIRLQPQSAAEDRIVPVHEEPRHRMIFETPGTRILDIQIPPGDTTLYHTHSEPILYVTMSTSRTRSQNHGGDWSAAPAASAPNAPGAPNAPSAPAPSAPNAPSAPTTPPGRMMSTTSYVEKPQTHRVNNMGDTLFRLIGVTNTTAGDLGESPSVGFQDRPEISNRWFRGYRVALAPSRSIEHRHANPVAVMLVAGAATVVIAGNNPVSANSPHFVAYVPGDSVHAVRASSTGAELVEVEIRRPR
jgi:hypothetical protein